jgi:hypothetical protein
MANSRQLSSVAAIENILAGWRQWLWRKAAAIIQLMAAWRGCGNIWHLRNENGQPSAWRIVMAMWRKAKWRHLRQAAGGCERLSRESNVAGP